MRFSVTLLSLGAVILLPTRTMTAIPRDAMEHPERVPAMAPVDTVRDTLAAQLATITTDTGALAPGHKDFSHYTTPRLCLAAAEVARDSFRQSLAAWTMTDTLAADTVGLGATAAIARRCGARFTLATAASPMDVLFELALYEQNDTLAQAALTAWAAQAASAKTRDSVWVLGLNEYLFFGRLAAAETLAAKVDASGVAAVPARLKIHRSLGRFFAKSGDSVSERQELERQLALGLHDPDKHESYPYVEDVWERRITQAVLMHPDAVSAMAQQAQQVLRRYSEADQQARGRTRPLDWGALPADSVVANLVRRPGLYTVWSTLYRHPAGGISTPRLQADFWIPAPGGSPGDTIVPVPGKVNIICAGGVDRRQANRLRHLLALYGDQGLAVTVVDFAQGFRDWYGVGNLTYSSFPTVLTASSPAAEAQHWWQWYNQVYRDLPVTVAVQIRRTTAWLPTPDGRRLSMSSTQYQQYIDMIPSLSGERNFFSVDGDYRGRCFMTTRDGTFLPTGLMVPSPLLESLFHGPHGGMSPSLHRSSTGIDTTATAVQTTQRSTP